MDNFNFYSLYMQHLMDSCIDNAVEFCNDMLMDSGDMDNTSLTMFREMILNQALQFMKDEIDPEKNDFEIPSKMYNAMSERIDQVVSVKFFLQ